MRDLSVAEEREIFQLATSAKIEAAWVKTTIKQYFSNELPPYIRLINAQANAIDNLCDAIRKLIT